jgi:hypothetical protein
VKATRPSTATQPEALDGEGGEAGAGLTLRSPRRAAVERQRRTIMHSEIVAGRGVLLIFKLADLLHAVNILDRWKMRVSLP